MSDCERCTQTVIFNNRTTPFHIAQCAQFCKSQCIALAWRPTNVFSRQQNRHIVMISRPLRRVVVPFLPETEIAETFLGALRDGGSGEFILDHHELDDHDVDGRVESAVTVD